MSLLVLISCSEEKSASGVPAMEFNLDPQQLGEVVVLQNAGIQFQPPLGWSPLIIGGVDSLGNRPDMVGVAGVDSLPMEPLHIFLDPAGGSVLSVSRLQLGEGTAFGDQIDQYAKALTDQFSQAELRQTQFLKDGIHIAQFLVQPQGLVNFKVIFEATDGVLLQFDFVVPDVLYPEEIRAVESSIASIVKTK